MKPGKYQLSIQVSIYQPDCGGRLEIREEIALNVSSFLEIASLLGRFHELAERVAVEKR